MNTSERRVAESEIRLAEAKRAKAKRAKAKRAKAKRAARPPSAVRQALGRSLQEALTELRGHLQSDRAVGVALGITRVKAHRWRRGLDVPQDNEDTHRVLAKARQILLEHGARERLKAIHPTVQETQTTLRERLDDSRKKARPSVGEWVLPALATDNDPPIIIEPARRDEGTGLAAVGAIALIAICTGGAATLLWWLVS